MLMLLVAERFFCPSLELISEYLHLPPCVAGATLLSFGNGAPDVFTQLAAISQGDADEVASPGAIAMALSEPLGSGLFVGNVVFALVIMFSGAREVRVQHNYFLKDCLFYLGGVATVFAFLLHGVVTVWECALLAAYYAAFIAATIAMARGDEPVRADPRLHEVPHRRRPLDSFLRESFRNLNFSFHSALSLHSHHSDGGGLEPEEVPLLRGRDGDGGGGGGVGRPSLDPIDEEGMACPPSPSDDEVLAGLDEEYGTAFSERDGFTNGKGDGAADAPTSPYLLRPPSSPPPLAVMYGGGAGGGGGGGLEAGLLPGAGADDACALCACSSVGGGLDGGGSSMRRSLSGAPPGRLQQLWRRVERPGLAGLSVFMPRIATGTHARYRKRYAVLLPPLLPTLLGWSLGLLDGAHAPGGFWRQPWWLGATAAGVAVGVAAVLYYPRRGHLHGYAAGAATVLVFAQAMFLLDAAAGELVAAAVALGQVYGISPSLLGATLLAWGNSVSDLVSNITLARDGLPSMALTACFASPLFVLLAGLVTSLTYATRHGDMALPQDLALRVLYGCSTTILLMWALVVPLLFRFRLNRRVAVLALVVYAVYQSLYIAAVIHDTRA